MSGRDLDERMQQWEIGLTHVERLYEQLNEVVADQARDLVKMRRRIVELEQQVKALKEGPPNPPPADPLDEPPPHY